ncbi:Zinc finger, C2H2-type/integrase, DNA-binding protein [Cordyceps fumosorosea ARSEF 2679]|uniref:Zinc finger, C2H2-type/integrase, DNA-binding protein n=1 Tax=Cordyceps fumosorosea (strain ARSEF 2679) TaxID=1081104 RepID=A0A168E402_CORFA|nr:Zinc finger, C2H2-type/integrase, DNA-binding protein [Cordyceps fumosorosea ARSEF 2679]OAA73347.1 Zinc finger, C2H2-type/integrase, DNA-binding protein [Cordyceps fumosorosea ARSEF 2679]
MSLANPRRRMMTRSGSIAEKEMALKATTSLQKGATFHSPSSPKSVGEGNPPPRLTRSQSSLDDVIDANRRRMALTSTISDIEAALSKTSLSEARPNRKSPLRDRSAPIPRGLFELPVVDPAMAKEQERRVLRPRSVRHNRHKHASDSGLGSSLASTNDKASIVDGSSKKTIKTHATSRTTIASNSRLASTLSNHAVNRIHEHTLGPLLQKPSLKPFQTIVVDVRGRIGSKDMICLRDIERSLLFMAPEKTKSATLYMDFCLTSIRCVQATVEYLTDSEQVRPGDRPYTNGYFIDLKEQIYEYGRLLATQEKGDLPEGMDIDKGDDVRLFGGIAENGRPAELIRVKKDGTAFSMATGKPVDLNEPPVKFKRSLSEQLDDDEEIMRSMARRKKNATPEELAPKKCREPGCNKEFKRPCDLTKHEKTHSRPWKCPIPTCKYHNYGWPTEKEMDRHVNDKHSDAPAMHECLFKPCPYKSKRESNCKQHMEKAHGWTYVRTKSSGKKMPSKPVTMDTPAISNLSPPNTTPSYSVPTPPQDVLHQDMSTAFPMYPREADWLATANISPESIDSLDLAHENASPSSTASSYEQFPPYQNGSAFIINNNDEDLYAARMHLPQHIPIAEQMYNKVMPQQMPEIPMVPLTGTYMDIDVPMHFSPAGQGNAMLYTPTSLREVDETFDEPLSNGDDVDFQLFDHVGKLSSVSLFDEMPSANMGFSQNTQPEMFADIDLDNLAYPFQD